MKVRVELSKQGWPGVLILWKTGCGSRLVSWATVLVYLLSLCIRVVAPASADVADERLASLVTGGEHQPSSCRVAGAEISPCGHAILGLVHD
jgi:hypothetical protein